MLIGLESIKSALMSAVRRCVPSLLMGETGTGKTSIASEVATDLKRPFIRVNLNGGITPAEVIGSYQLDGKRTYFKEGILPIAMRSGSVLLLDEINSALPDTLFCLHPVLEEKPRLFIPEINEEVRTSSGFAVIATANPAHDYAGTKTLNHALYSRFACVLRFSNLSGSDLISALHSHVPDASSTDVLKITELFSEIQGLLTSGEINTRVSIRECISTLKFIKDGLSYEEAVKVAIMGKLEGYEMQKIKGESSVPNVTMKIPEILSRLEQVSELEKLRDQYAEELKKYSSIAEAVKGLV